MIVKGMNDQQLAQAPTLSVREVKTYARIANDTPFIVGGLIAKDSGAIDQTSSSSWRSSNFG